MKSGWLQSLPRLIRLEAAGFALLIALMALDEYLDLPQRLFGELPTPLRHPEFLMESAAVCLIAVIVLGLTWLAHRRLRQIDSLLVMCAWCRQVRVDNRWMPLETFLKEQNAITTTRGLCPDCYEGSGRQDSR
jgi:hypothetical protein